MRDCKSWTLFLRIFVLIYHLVEVHPLDYCAHICTGGATHVGCGADYTAFGSSCPPDVERVDLAPHIDAITKAHNTRRNLVASGKLEHFKPAARMATTQWDNEFADLAFLNVKSCTLNYAACNAIDAYPHPGQNVGTFSWTLTNLTILSALEVQIESWFSEHTHVEVAQIDKFTPTATGETIGHFTVMVNQNNTHFGCGAVKYSQNEQITFALGCNYAVNNFMGLPVYETADVAGSGCLTGPNPDYEFLCSTQEQYNWI